jgi:hypothetical protein
MSGEGLNIEDQKTGLFVSDGGESQAGVDASGLEPFDEPGPVVTRAAQLSTRKEIVIELPVQEGAQ